jgi:hypothetical protein
MLNLKENQYDRQTLKNNIYAIDLLELLKTQHIDVTFAVRYLLNKNYDLDDKYNITPQLIVKYQPHITLKSILYETLRYDSDDDSVEDFESVSKK